jgi:hypothetical protein
MGLSNNLLGVDPAVAFGLMFYIVYSILDDNGDSSGITLHIPLLLPACLADP